MLLRYKVTFPDSLNSLTFPGIPGFPHVDIFVNEPEEFLLLALETSGNSFKVKEVQDIIDEFLDLERAILKYFLLSQDKLIWSRTA